MWHNAACPVSRHSAASDLHFGSCRVKPQRRHRDRTTNLICVCRSVVSRQDRRQTQHSPVFFWRLLTLFPTRVHFLRTIEREREGAGEKARRRTVLWPDSLPLFPFKDFRTSPAHRDGVTQHWRRGIKTTFCSLVDFPPFPFEDSTPIFILQPPHYS